MVGDANGSAQALLALAAHHEAAAKALRSRADMLERGNPGVAQAEVFGDAVGGTVGGGVEGDGVQAREAGSVGEDVLDEAPPLFIPAGAEYEPLREYINSMEWPYDNEALKAMEEDVQGFWPNPDQQQGWPGVVDRERWTSREAALEGAQGAINFIDMNPENFRNMKGGRGDFTMRLMGAMRAIQSTVNPAGGGQSDLRTLWNAGGANSNHQR